MLVGGRLLIVNGLPVGPVTTVAHYVFRRGSRIHNENPLNLRLRESPTGAERRCRSWCRVGQRHSLQTLDQGPAIRNITVMGALMRIRTVIGILLAVLVALLIVLLVF